MLAHRHRPARYRPQGGDKGDDGLYREIYGFLTHDLEQELKIEAARRELLRLMTNETWCKSEGDPKEMVSKKGLDRAGRK